MRLEQWIQQYENDPRILLPKVAEQVNARRAFSEAYGRRSAANALASANEAHTANLRRTRAVLVGLATVRDKLATDPNYTVARASSDAATLRSEYERLRADLPRLASRVETAREIERDPTTWAEQRFERFPALGERLPSLPNF